MSAVAGPACDAHKAVVLGQDVVQRPEVALVDMRMSLRRKRQDDLAEPVTKPARLPGGGIQVVGGHPLEPGRVFGVDCAGLEQPQDETVPIPQAVGRGIARILDAV